MAVNFSPIFNGWQGFTAAGLPLSGGQIFTYLAGTSTPSPTYTTSVGNVANANPIVLNADGRPPQEIWLTSTVSYKLVLQDSLGNQLGTYDNITGIDNSTPAALSEWVVTGLAPAYVNATTFTLAGDQTATFQIGRRVQYQLGSGLNTGSITNSVFGAVTTVTVVTDSIPLDVTLSAVNVGFLTATKPSVPTNFKSPISGPSIAISGAATIGSTAVISGLVTGSVGMNVGNIAQASATTLDWYQEGSTTMSIAGSTTAGTATYGGRIMRWTRIGQLFVFDLFLDWTAFTGTGFILITGTFPFTVSSSVPTAVTITSENLTYPNDLSCIVTSSAGGTIQIGSTSSGGTFSLIAVDATATIYISGSVRVA
jgi:hypothetical protein